MGYKKINIPNKFSQWDSRWASDLLGNNTDSRFNIYNYGCLISCLAMTCNYYGYSTDPKKINEKLKANGGFQANNGNYVWGSIKNVYANITEEKQVRTPLPLTDAQMQEIKQAINEGYPVMIQTDYNPRTIEPDMHFVLVVGYNPEDENDLLIIDPLGGVERSLKHYLGWFRPSARKSIEQYIIYKGKVPASTSLKDTEIDFNDGEGKRHTVGWYVYEWFNEKTGRAKDNEVTSKEITDLRKDIVTINQKLDEAFELVSSKEKVITNKETTILALQQVITNKDKEISILKEQALSNYTVGDLLVLIFEKVKGIKIK